MKVRYLYNSIEDIDFFRCSSRNQNVEKRLSTQVNAVVRILNADLKTFHRSKEKTFYIYIRYGYRYHHHSQDCKRERSYSSPRIYIKHEGLRQCSFSDFSGICFIHLISYFTIGHKTVQYIFSHIPFRLLNV